MTTDHTPSGATATAATTTTSWFGIQTLGPVLMMLFGLVLIFTPLASVGAAGSVGNAGAQFPKCPPTGGGGQIGGGGNAGNAAIVAPGQDCPTTTTAAPTTAPPTTAAPPTAAPTTAAPTTAAPTTAAPGEPDPTPLPGEAPPVLGGTPDEQPEVEGIVVADPDGTEVLDARTARDSTTTGGSGGGSGHDTAELAFTGPQDSSLLTTAVGAVMVLGGGALLFLSRRRASATC